MCVGVAFVFVADENCTDFEIGFSRFVGTAGERENAERHNCRKNDCEKFFHLECTLRIFACYVSFETKQQQNYTQKLTKMQQEYAQNRIYEPRYICWQTGLIGSVFCRKKLPVPPEPAPPAVDAAFKVTVIYELRKHILFKHGHGA